MFLTFQFIKLADFLLFYLESKIKSENRGKTVVLPPNKSKDGIFLFQAMIGYINFFQSWHVLYEKNRAQVPRVSSINHLGCLVDLQYFQMVATFFDFS